MKANSILIIENSELDILLIKEALMQNEPLCEVKIIKDGPAAALYTPFLTLQGLQEKPDLIIVNEALLHIDEINELLTSRKPHQDSIPIVLLTEKDKVIKYNIKDIREVITKPLEVKKFVDAILKISCDLLPIKHSKLQI